MVAAFPLWDCCDYLRGINPLGGGGINSDSISWGKPQNGGKDAASGLARAVSEKNVWP
jgi:hypothetical protein